jgi:hypothetical protein
LHGAHTLAAAQAQLDEGALRLALDVSKIDGQALPVHSFDWVLHYGGRASLSRYV